MPAPEKEGVPSAAEAPQWLSGGPLWWRRIVRIRGVLSVLGLWLLIAVGVSAAFLLTPARFTAAIPDDEALGTIATQTIKANRDTDVLDSETTERKRDDAARSVWPVYDFDAGAAALLQQRISSAFGEGRAAVEQWQRQNPTKSARISAVQEAHTRQPLLHKKPLPEEAELLQFLEDHRDAFLKALQAVIENEDYLELARAGFDPTVERAALRLAGLASGGFAVAERELLAADRERGIAVRTLADPRGAAPSERQVRDIDRIRDLAQLKGEVDRLAQEQLGDVQPPLRRALAQLVRRALRPNLAYDDAETRRRIEEQRAAVKDVILQVKKGEKIIGDGEQVTKAHLLVFRAIREAGRSAGTAQVRWGGGIFAALLCAALFEFGRRNVRKFRLRSRDVLLLAAALIGQLLLTRGSLAGVDWLVDQAREAFGVRSQLAQLCAELLFAAVPFAAGAMLVRFLLYSEAALIWTVAAAPLCGLLVQGGLQPAVMALVCGVVAADRVGHAGSRSAIFRAGVWTAGAGIMVIGSFALFQARFWTPETAAAMAGAALGNALLVPLVVLIFAPLAEVSFGHVTDIQLIKLANFNHPVLKDLIVQAPGTYHHSIVSGALVEAAARAIGANPLLARVGAYYHDIGKGKNPLYFGENHQSGHRHDTLTPQMSALVIKRHVSEGIELARQAKLPAAVIDFVPQHHGTRLVGYFFHRAREEAERKGEPPPAERDFRYPGPKPQSREAALVMIADVVVATARNLADSAPNVLREKLRQLVDHAIQGVIADSQLDECELTLRDLEKTAQAFVEALLGIYRARPEMPSAGTAAAPHTAPALHVLGPEGATTEPDLRRAGKP